MTIRCISWGYKKIALVCTVIAMFLLALSTYLSVLAFPLNLEEMVSVTRKNTYVDRHGQALNVTYENRWNIRDRIQIHNVPEFLQMAFILSEDKRYFSHSGVDWLARINALWQNIIAAKTVRGASTITEQVVRMIHPRPRTLWSRWIEGFEAMVFEYRFNKLDILEFYINQVPYKANRRGIIQASHYYFDRDIHTLNEKEMLALAILVRSPKWLDPTHQSNNIKRAISNLSKRLIMANLTTISDADITKQKLSISPPSKQYNAQHFIQYANDQIKSYNQQGDVIHVTIDSELQRKIQSILNSRLNHLNQFNVNNGAVLVVNHESNEILSWVVGYAGEKNKKNNQLNAVVVGRQPGSTLKPLLYTSALTKGWTAATMLDDSPLEEGVGSGMHTYHNYSRAHYGPVSLREALGNSLNIPAVRTIQFVGADNFLKLLSDVGVQSLSVHPNVYGDGLALGNGELTLFELVQAYTVIARMGDFKPLSFIEGEHLTNSSYRVLSEDVASLIADIMSDPVAREKEFGWGSVLNFPHQTAVKTGTSSDYRDAWAVGFDDKYTVGIWMGNLDYSEMQEVTGSTGPALVLRTVFNELNRNRDANPIYFSKHLVKQSVCIETGILDNGVCDTRDEWLIGNANTPDPASRRSQETKGKPHNIRLRKPSNGLMMAMDPRIPDDHEYFEFALTDIDNIQSVNWYVNSELVATTDNSVFHWKLTKGNFVSKAEVWLQGREGPIVTKTVAYKVN